MIVLVILLLILVVSQVINKQRYQRGDGINTVPWLMQTRLFSFMQYHDESTR